jgi:hypothetical protein
MGIFAKEVVRDVRAVCRAWRHWRQKGGTRQAAEAVTLAIVAAATANATQAASVQPKAASAASPVPVVIIPVPAGPSLSARMWRVVRPKLIIAVGATLEFLLKAADHAAVRASRASMQLYGKAVQVWLWAEPYLRRFDAWLEHSLKTNKDIAAVIHFWNELWKTAAARVAELRSRLARTPRSPEE